MKNIAQKYKQNYLGQLFTTLRLTKDTSNGGTQFL